jgi:hypothetical protein
MKDGSLCQVKRATRYKRRIKPVLEDSDYKDVIQRAGMVTMKRGQKNCRLIERGGYVDAANLPFKTRHVFREGKGKRINVSECFRICVLPRLRGVCLCP